MYIYTNQINKNNHTVTQYSHTERSLKIYRSTEGKLMLTLSRMVNGSIKKDIFSLLAGAAAKLLQSCPTQCDPRDGSPPGSSVHGIFQRRELEWGAIAFSHINYTSIKK